MQQVHQMSFCAVQASFKIAQAAPVMRLLEKLYPPIPYCCYQSLHITIRTAVVHNFYLHDIFTRVLLQYAFQCKPQEVGTIESWNHNRP